MFGSRLLASLLVKGERVSRGYSPHRCLVLDSVGCRLPAVFKTPFSAWLGEIQPEPEINSSGRESKGRASIPGGRGCQERGAAGVWGWRARWGHCAQAPWGCQQPGPSPSPSSALCALAEPGARGEEGEFQNNKGKSSASRAAQPGNSPPQEAAAAKSRCWHGEAGSGFAL